MVSQWNLRRLIRIFVIFGIIFSLSGSYLWYSRLYLNDERKFWMAIENSMSTPSVTRTLTSGGTGNQVVQKNQIHFSPNMVTNSLVTFNQRNATEDTLVTTEGISFPDALYSRYTEFSTTSSKPDGTKPTLDPVLGEWEANIPEEELLEQSKFNYVSELVTLVVFGNFDAEFRNDVIKSLQDSGAYDINFAGVSDDVIDGSDVRLFPVSVRLKPYVEQLQRAFVHAGYGEFPPLDPANYTEDSRVPVTIAVDKQSGAIAGVSFGGRQESYSGYGIRKTIEKPETKYESGELERIVQEELQGVL